MTAPTPNTNGATASKLRLSFDDKASLLSKQLTVIVGNETSKTAKTFSAPQDVLTQHSDFFAAAVHKGWREAEERIVRLPEQDPEIFQIFLKFAYTGKVYSKKEGDLHTMECGGRGDHELSRLGFCWRLGEVLLSTTFQDAAIDALTQKSTEENFYPTGLHERHYPDSATPNGMSRFLVDVAIWCWNDKTWDAKITKASVTPGGLCRDIASRQRELLAAGHNAKDDAPYHKQDCTYHEHVKTGAPCYKTIFRQT